VKLSTINFLLAFVGLALIVSVPGQPEWVDRYPVRLWLTWSWHARAMTEGRGYKSKEVS
jgi:hypothetical protein